MEKKQAMKKVRRNNGFSLIELLLVLVILAALASVIVPKFAGRGKQAKVTATQLEIKNLSNALNTFEIENDRFPTTSEGLKALIEKPANATGWEKPYLEKQEIPKDPWGNEYTYRQPGQRNEYSFDLSSAGPDGKANTEDDITNWAAESN